jgi:hypothetical protein
MSLRIPLTVKRCAGVDRAGRVRYQDGDRCLIPEDIVLRRWQERTSEPRQRARDIRFDGCRLPSGTWTLLREWSREEGSPNRLTDPDVLERYAAQNRSEGGRLRTPVAAKFALLIAYLIEKKLLDAVISLERSPENPGLPDLFLYRVDRAQRVHDGRFVEVKKRNRRTGTREPASPGQIAEIKFLKSLGLRADVIYLLE